MSRTAFYRRLAPVPRSAGRPSDAMTDRQKRDDQEWALQRRLEDVFAKLGEKFGDLTGRVETQFRPTVTFDDVGGVRQAKAELRGFAVALTNPRSEEHTSELQSHHDLVCRLLLEKKKKQTSA